MSKMDEDIEHFKELPANSTEISSEHPLLMAHPKISPLKKKIIDAREIKK